MNSITSRAPGIQEEKAAADAVSYDGPPLVEIELEGVQYRIDAGKQGTALCISTRAPGTWDWSYGGEARWDGSALRTRAFERKVLLSLAVELKAASLSLE